MGARSQPRYENFTECERQIHCEWRTCCVQPSRPFWFPRETSHVMSGRVLHDEVSPMPDITVNVDLLEAFPCIPPSLYVSDLGKKSLYFYS